MPTLTPAYGRDYKSKKTAVEAFRADHDWILHDMTSPWDGRPVNMSQLAAAGHTSVVLRYGKLRKVAVTSVVSPCVGG